MTLAAPELCPVCLTTYKPGAVFCGACGHRRMPASHEGGAIKLVISFYLAMLGVSTAGMIYGRITDDYFGAFTAASVGFAILTLGFALPRRELIREPSRTAGFTPWGYALVVLASVPIVALVGGYVHALHSLFGIHVPGELDEFAGKHVLWPILLIVIVPPLEEELAFRGVIYGGLRKTLGVSESFLISSFAFAMLHLSVPSLVTHFPLGLYFCWLRHRSGSLWPGVLAHMCHNLGVCVLEWM